MSEPEYKNVDEVLSFVQKNIVAPKSQYNKFGEYYYRDAEDILEAAKKVLPDFASITVTDDVIFVPCETEFVQKENADKSSCQKSAGRVYIKSTATLAFKGEGIDCVGLAREELSKKGMDASQVTAATSSYARKIALNGLLMIDDSKDANKDDKTTKKEKDDQALMDKTGTDNINDAKATSALGGSVRKDVDEELVKTMYEQGLKAIAGAADKDTLKKVWTHLAKGKPVFSAEQWADLEQAKDEAKNALAPF